MASFVLNVRVDQIYAGGSVLRLPRTSLKAAIEAAGSEVLLFATSREHLPGYYGTALLGEPFPDPLNKTNYWLPLHNERPLSRTVTLEELRELSLDEMPFHTYSRPIRRVAEAEYAGLVKVGAITEGFEEQEQVGFTEKTAKENWRSADDRALRFEMFDAHGTACLFTGRSFPALNGFRYGTDMGHLWPKSAGGPSILQNVLPMTKDVNFQWDEGLVSLRDGGEILIAKHAGEDTRALFSRIERIRLPGDVSLWPDAKYLERHRDEIFEKGPKWLSSA